MDSVKSEPFPPRLITCGLPGALSVIVIEPVFEPEEDGVNVTLIVQLACTAREVPQVLLWVKSPVAAMLVIVRGAEPVLVKTTCCAALAIPTG